MKIQSLILATAIALVPATAAFADDAKKEALKKAKEAAKEKAIEKAKEKSEAKTEKAKEKAAEKQADAKKAADEAKEKALVEEKETHAKNLGAIERLEQIATATNNADLTSIVARLKDKEAKRHSMVAGEG